MYTVPCLLTEVYISSALPVLPVLNSCYSHACPPQLRLHKRLQHVVARRVLRLLLLGGPLGLRLPLLRLGRVLHGLLLWLQGRVLRHLLLLPVRGRGLVLRLHRLRLGSVGWGALVLVERRGHVLLRGRRLVLRLLLLHRLAVRCLALLVGVVVLLRDGLWSWR